jgi:hypothetical protein
MHTCAHSIYLPERLQSVVQDRFFGHVSQGSLHSFVSGTCMTQLNTYAIRKEFGSTSTHCHCECLSDALRSPSTGINCDTHKSVRRTLTYGKYSSCRLRTVQDLIQAVSFMYDVIQFNGLNYESSRMYLEVCSKQSTFTSVCLYDCHNAAFINSTFHMNGSGFT